MKAIQLTIIFFLISGYLMAQQKQVGEIAVITFPAGAEKLADQQLKTLRGTSNSPALNESWNSPAEEHYRINTFFLELHAELVTTPNSSLEDVMKNIDLLNKQSNGTGKMISGIKTINNYSVFIAQLDSKDWGFYSFYTLSDDKTKIINGMLHYDKSDPDIKDKALKVINELLPGITFK